LHPVELNLPSNIPVPVSLNSKKDNASALGKLLWCMVSANELSNT
jgi:hypothetical protein